MSNEALKPCPWCGSERIGRDVADIFCLECESVGPRVSFGAPLNAEERWNTRSTDTPVCVSTEDMRAKAEAIVAANLDAWGWGPLAEVEGLAEHDLAVKACAAGLAASQAPETTAIHPEAAEVVVLREALTKVRFWFAGYIANGGKDADEELKLIDAALIERLSVDTGGEAK